VYGSESRAVDVTRDEMSDYCRHSVCQRQVINTGAESEEKAERALGVEENCIILEVFPLEYTFQFWDVLLSIRSHCVDPLSAKFDYTRPVPPTHTLLIITNENHLPQRRLIPGHYWQVIANFYLACFVDDNGLDRDDRGESAIHDPLRRQHADRAKDDSSTQHHTFIVLYCALEFPGFDHVSADVFV